MRRLLFLHLLLLALLPSPAAHASGFGLTAPLAGQVVKGFDQVGRYEAGHRGVDLAGSVGQDVHAAALGRVHFAGYVAGRGTVSIDHGNGWRTTYQPVTPTVAEGDEVAAGERIGRLAPGHCATPCLHWGLTDGDRYKDPLAYLLLAPVRLLPHGSEPPSPPPALPPATLPTEGGLPVDGTITSRFGMRRHPITGVYKLHDGLDIAAPCGTPIRSYAAGTVTRASYNSAYGYRVVVDHGSGFVTAYTHMPGLEVAVGTAVSAGQRIGAVGTTGLSTGCHLHWMAWRHGRLIDPLTLT